MTLRPSNKVELADLLRSANGRRTQLAPVELGAFHRIIEHTPEDMTVTVEAGIPLKTLQAALAQKGQWLPIDPANPERLTIASLLSMNTSGPRRFGFGTIRDHLIGLQVVLADGRLIRSGGKVVKNVAGYDLLKLFVGAHDTLGFIVEAAFKLLPLPESEHFVRARSGSLDDCRRLIESVLDSELTPVVLDCHNTASIQSEFFVVLGFSGTYEDVDWQLGKASALGFCDPATLDYEREFLAQGSAKPQRLSVLPSRLAEAIGQLGGVSFVARAGNGVIHYRGGAVPSGSESKTQAPALLLKKVKDIFDPNHILPDFPQ